MADGRVQNELSIADITTIQQLVAAYGWHVDDGDGERFAALFTDDAVLDLGVTTIDGGREAIARFAESVPDRVPGVRHLMTNIILEGLNGEVTARCYLETYRKSEDGAILRLAQLGRCHYRLRRVGEQWRFAHVHVRTDPVG